uniref:Putative glycosyltransferase n=1 Tax=viral metagenome TaxID=1070528 RepID=A0A6M3KC63_9ZZZZ
MIFATIDNGTYNTFLKKSDLPDVMVLKMDRSPAKLYNDILDKVKDRYVCFIHSDVACKGLREAITQTIPDRPNCLIGAVGVNNGLYWSRKEILFDLITCDSCCVVIDQEMNLRFDDQLFNEYHLYIEDICMLAREKGFGVTTMYIDGFEQRKTFKTDRYFIHHSYTLNRLGCSWGNYNRYRALLGKKWPNVQTT